MRNDSRLLERFYFIFLDGPEWLVLWVDLSVIIIHIPSAMKKNAIWSFFFFLNGVNFFCEIGSVSTLCSSSWGTRNVQRLSGAAAVDETELQ